MYDETIKRKVWKKDMIEELKTIEKSHIWELVTLLGKKKKIVVKSIIKVIMDPYGTISKSKIKLVARGFL